MNQMADIRILQAVVDAQVFGARGEWEKHETGMGHTAYIKPIHTRDVELKARIATRYDELGFVPKFFSEAGREFVALEGLKKAGRYRDVEEAFAKTDSGQIVIPRSSKMSDKNKTSGHSQDGSVEMTVGRINLPVYQDGKLAGHELGLRTIVKVDTDFDNKADIVMIADQSDANRHTPNPLMGTLTVQQNGKEDQYLTNAAGSLISTAVRYRGEELAGSGVKSVLDIANSLNMDSLPRPGGRSR